ncbi:hypothetical protein BUALT_Bualt10G0037900 [Buddleja alternifolia]|uniref:TTF-type domain-containing protein n=1 Tax=Buddleja alternifolia TaxID=168488 RepID=A0AAV6X6L0_9LAMI|nr:hypothetical protein BUALT_Bualt10G0037900 [Buddleja alternifolia]
MYKTNVRLGATGEWHMFKSFRGRGTQVRIACSASTSQFDRPPKVPRVENKEIDISSLERDPGLCRQISEYPIEQRDKVRRAYIMAGPYQPRLGKYPLSGVANHLRSFQESWYEKFSSWLEYSTNKDASFCLPCYVFNNISNNRFGTNAFTETGFRNWRKVNDGNRCAFLKHIGTNPSSPHNQCVRACDDLMAQSQHIDKILHKQSSNMIAENRLRLKTSIDAIRWLTFQACALRGNDERIDSLNRAGRGRGRHQMEPMSMEHYYRINLFIATIDTQWQELNSRFNEKNMELLSLSSTFDPREDFKLLNVEHIGDLATKFYPADFTEQEILHLRIQARHYELDVPRNLEFKQLSTISELCRQMKMTKKDVRDKKAYVLAEKMAQMAWEVDRVELKRSGPRCGWRLLDAGPICLDR